jgi:predicted acyltransferase
VRNQPLDILRGFAIFGMILSGTIAFGGSLPAWMYHAQLPPPRHTFTPSQAGITWVDLVFPFFLFAMGVAIPFSAAKSKRFWSDVFLPSLKRYLFLIFFAFFYYYMRPFVLGFDDTTNHMASVVAFVLIVLALFPIKQFRYATLLQFFTVGICIVLLASFPYSKAVSYKFSVYKSDIIIVVLANMAFFGVHIYHFTKKNWWARVAVLPIVLAIFLSAAHSNPSWQKELFNFNSISTIKIDAFYKFYFLKYLFIVIPATIVGDILKQHQLQEIQYKFSRRNAASFIIIMLYIICGNLFCLHSRYLFANLLSNVVLYSIGYYVLRLLKLDMHLRQLFQLAGYLLLLGLCIEAYEGGIKKDVSTYSYYFVCTALAIFFYLATFISYQTFGGHPLLRYFEQLGKNPLMAYMMFALILTPMLFFTGLIYFFEGLKYNMFVSFMRGFVASVLCGLIANFLTKKKIILKT